MKKLHVIARNWGPGDGGAGYLNSLAFYTKDDEKLPVTDIVGIGSTGPGGVTFKLNGVNARIEWFNNYGYSYYPTNIFATGASYSYAILLYNMNSLPIEKQGFYVYFDKDITNIAYITLLSTYYVATNFVVSVDDGKWSDPVPTVGNEVFRIPIPRTRLRAILGKNGHYYFRKPKVTEPVS